MKKPLAIILGVGFLHRLLFLGARQLWTDELMQARVIKSASPVEILRRLRGEMDLASPLDFMVQRGVTVLLGNAAWALRLHALVFGTLSIWIFFRLARRLFGERVALYSTILFAFYPLAYRYSLEARPYALLLFLSLLSYDLLLSQIYGKDRSWKGWLLITGISTLLLYTNFLGSLILISQFAGLMLAMLYKPRTESDLRNHDTEREHLIPVRVKKRHAWAYLLAAFTALALFYPWIRYEWARPHLSPASEIAQPKVILILIKGLGDNSYPVAVLLLLGAVAGMWVLFRHGRHNALFWLASWFLVPIPALWLAEVWAGYFFNIRHVLHLTPPILLLAGYGISHLGNKLALLPQMPRPIHAVGLSYAGLLICMSIWISQDHARSETADWLGVATFLNETVRPGDAVSMPVVNALLEYYYPRLRDFRAGDLDPGPGSLAETGIRRRIVVCREQLWPDPCAAFRDPASRDSAWATRAFNGFTVFIRER
jgi:hypothetical protein